MIGGARWQRGKELFERALQIPAGEREHFLREHLGDDQELIEEIASLIAAHREDDFLAEPAPLELALGDSYAAETEDPLLGQTFGSWRLVREIGHGGMGSVYEGRHVGDEFDQRVAVKLLAPGLFGAAFRERFVAERRILASLEHENIARLLDGGTTPEGLPYFVMEYVEGAPIDRYCEKYELSVEARLELMLRVCAAVRTAHQKLVVHRDLKPGNILVTEAGIPKLLDFGIATLLDPRGGVAITRSTAAGVRPMTPQYASPEQVAGEPVTVASDVYSLGVLLYQLLTGQLPHRPTDPDDGVHPRTSAEAAEPRRPSTAIGRTRRKTSEGLGGAAAEAPIRAGGASRERLRRQLAGDIDNIVLKALVREPTRRYPSVQDLDEDLRRHLSGLPVTARRTSFAYRAAKYVRRNRLPLAATAVILILVAGLVALSLRYTADLERERNAALAARELSEHREIEARELADFLVELFQAPDPDQSRGASVTARELLASGAERIERELTDHPLTLARLLETIGQVYTGLGLWNDAEPLLQRSLELRQEHAGDQPLLVASSLAALGHLAGERRSFPEAADLHRHVLDLRRSALADEDPMVADSVRQLAAYLRYDPDRLQEAETLSREALETLEGQLDPGDRRVLSAMTVRAGILAALGEAAAAEDLYLDLLARQRSTLGADDPNLALTYNNLGYLYRRQERLQEAETAYRSSLALQEPVYGADHPNTVHLQLNLAAVLSELGKKDETESILRRVVEIRRSTSPLNEHLLASALAHGLGNFLLQEQRWPDAVEVLREGIAVRNTAAEPDAVHAALDHGLLAAGLLGMGDRRSGERWAREALTTLGRDGFPPWTELRVRQIADYLEAAGGADLAGRFRALLETGS